MAHDFPRKPMIRANIRFPREAHDKLKRWCRMNGSTIQEAVTALVERAVRMVPEKLEIGGAPLDVRVAPPPRFDVNGGPDQPAMRAAFAPAPKVETTDEKEYRLYMNYVGVCKTMGYPVKLFEEFQATINSVDTNDEDDSIDL